MVLNGHNTDSFSNSSVISPDNKRQNIQGYNKYSTLRDNESSDSDSDNIYSSKCDENPKIVDYFNKHKDTTDTPKTTMSDSEYPENIHTWANNFQIELNNTISVSIKSAIANISTKIDELMDSNKFLEHKIDATATTAKYVNKTIKSLQTKLNQQEGIIR